MQTIYKRRSQRCGLTNSLWLRVKGQKLTVCTRKTMPQNKLYFFYASSKMGATTLYTLMKGFGDPSYSSKLHSQPNLLVI